MLARIEIMEMIFDDFNLFVNNFDKLEYDSIAYDQVVEFELPYWTDELNWGLEAIIAGVKEGLGTNEEVWNHLS